MLDHNQPGQATRSRTVPKAAEGRGGGAAQRCVAAQQGENAERYSACEALRRVAKEEREAAPPLGSMAFKWGEA